MGGCENDGYKERERESNVNDNVIKRYDIRKYIIDINEKCDKKKRRGSMGYMERGM
jgi:hypothetical protein